MLHVLHCTSIVCIIVGGYRAHVLSGSISGILPYAGEEDRGDGNISMLESGCRLGENEHAQGHVNHPQSLPNVLNLMQAATYQKQGQMRCATNSALDHYRLLTCLKTTKMTNSEPGIYGRYARQRSKINHRARIWSSAEGDAQAFHWLGMTTQGEQAVG